MILLSTLTTSVVILCFSGGTTARKSITGFENDYVTLPCTYSAGKEAAQVCWKKSDCSKSACNSAILQTSGSSVTKGNSYKYMLLENITWGDASLTIARLTTKDEGIYCCTVIIPGPSNDVKREINLQIIKMPVANVIGSLDDTVTLPCTYSANKGVTGLCWGRGGCSEFSCADAIFRTNSSRVIRKSNRYELLGNLTQGYASLTISNLTTEDEGVYCCKVVIPGPFNDVKKEISLQILSTVNWNTLGNVIRGIIIILVPTMVLLIYKCCSLESHKELEDMVY